MLAKLLRAHLPRIALGLTSDGARMIELERKRDAFAVRRAAEVALPENLLRSSFDEKNIADLGELRARLEELAAHAGLAKRRRWSVALPEAATRTSVITVEEMPARRAELEEILRWKTERSFGAAMAELYVARVKLNSFAGQSAKVEGARYLLTAIRADVLSEYENLFSALGWQAGLILPRHAGEEFWLSRECAQIFHLKKEVLQSDTLLISAHRQGFTAVILREGSPLFVRNVVCEAEDCADELYRFLLFYRQRALRPPNAEDFENQPDDFPAHNLSSSPMRLLVTGESFDANAARNIVAETFSAIPQLINAEDVRLRLPSDEFSFARFAAPAGLAALAWR